MFDRSPRITLSRLASTVAAIAVFAIAAPLASADVLVTDSTGSTSPGTIESLPASDTTPTDTISSVEPGMTGLPDPIPCGTRDNRQPFLAVDGDDATYWLMPNGGFENGTAEWTLTGNAYTVSGNEPWYVRDPADVAALRIGAGSTAMSRAFCVRDDEQTIRFFAKASGYSWPYSTLTVEELVEDQGRVDTYVVAVIPASSAQWFPTRQLYFAFSYDHLTNGQTNVAFRFTAQGGPWRIDDVYVDPFLHR